ncbi:ORF6N domain-containing protein [Bacteroides caecigallinarum]|uniref:ORF6N domain-containing protein n=1 Tax=Bacteroides caecigallinarum TaxID=1411144 RepID=UPI001EF60D89|nr:ORF6N domain-containing protein [Bacteroides caecigallinarum]MDN0073044.1 ORF6N domain-containing protein [Bacteroides caecigallinarum]
MESNIIEKHEEDISPKVVNMFEKVRGKIISLRNSQVILDSDIAELYDVETKRVNEAVKNNKDKFPDDYMFQLTNEEVIYLRSKNSTANISPKSRVLPNLCDTYF